MQVATCPTCGSEVGTEHMLDPLNELAYSLGALLINAAMIRVALAQPGYEPTVAGFMERLKELSSVSRHEAVELQGWGEAYDDADEEEDEAEE